MPLRHRDGQVFTNLLHIYRPREGEADPHGTCMSGESLSVFRWWKVKEKPGCAMQRKHATIHVVYINAKREL